MQQKRESLSDDYTPLDPQSRSYCSIEEALKKSLRSSKNSDDVPANPSEISTDSVVRDCDSAVTTPKNPLRRPIKLALPGVTPSSSPFIESEHSVKLLEDVNKGASEEQGDYFSASLESPTPRSVVVSKSPSLNRIDSDFDEVEDEDHVCSCKYCGQDFKR